MCGIAGLINCGNDQTLTKMINTIHHRGPDDNGIKWFPKYNSGLGHQRLSIIDLSSLGHQPMTNESENLWITYNGEIYNYKEIKNALIQKGYHFKSDSDTEVLLKSYQEWGSDCLSKLNGMFAFAIFNTDNEELFAARDHLGIKPFFYYYDGKIFLFSSEIKAILSSQLVEKSPDYFSLHTPTRFQISPYTGFKNILKLPAGFYLKYKNGKLEIKQYWDIDIKEGSDYNEDELIEQLDFLLNEGVRLQMISDVPVGILLSGGLDSSLIAAMMRKNTKEDIHSFTIKFTDEDQKYEKIGEDYIYARQVAKNFNFISHEIEIKPDVVDLLPRLVWHMDEPVADASAINTYLISEAAREIGIIVLLSGMGGDEIFGGYRKQLACLRADLYQSFFPKIFRTIIQKIFDKIPVATSSRGLRSIRWIKRFLSFASLPRIIRFLSSDMSLTPEQYIKIFGNEISYEETHFYTSQLKHFSDPNLSYLSQMCLNDTKIFLAEHNLTVVDRSSMAASIETRPPLIDKQVVEFMFTLQQKYKIRGNTQKYLQKRVAEKYLPSNIIYREKAGFAAPLRSWVRGQLSEMIGDLLSESSVKSRGLYNPQHVAELIKRDKIGMEDNSYLIWWLLNNEIWFRTYFN